MTLRERLFDTAVSYMVKRTNDKTGMDISTSEIYMAEITDAAEGLVDALMPEIESLSKGEDRYTSWGEEAWRHWEEMGG